MIETLLLNWKLIVIGALIFSLGLMSSLYVDKRDELIVFKAQVDQAGIAQEMANAELKAKYSDTLIQIRSEHESRISEIRANAGVAYARRVPKPDTYRGEMPGTPAGIKLDDGTSQKLVLDDPFIADCAEDAAKLTAFQDYCKYNGCPVEP